MKVLIVGATRGIGREVARRFAERGDDVLAAGRDGAELERTKADLSARLPGRGSAQTLVLDLAQPAGFGAAVAQARTLLSGIDAVVVTAGLFGPQDELLADAARLEAMLDTNFTKTILWCEAVKPALLASRGVLCVLTSVAGDRGRGSIYAYGASKAGLSAYLEGLDHRYAKEGLAVVNIKPGFVRTGMTAGLKEPPFAADVQPVADAILRAIDARQPVAYVVPIWGLVMAVIKRLPRFVMRRINF